MFNVGTSLLLALVYVRVIAQTFLEFRTCKLVLHLINYLYKTILSFLAVTVFCYYQFYCFQDAQQLFNSLQNAINSNVNVSLTEFVNTTQLEGFSAQICAATSPLRELIDSQLPWFQYQEWTWLAAGE